MAEVTGTSAARTGRGVLGEPGLDGPGLVVPVVIDEGLSRRLGERAGRNGGGSARARQRAGEGEARAGQRRQRES